MWLFSKTVLWSPGDLVACFGLQKLAEPGLDCAKPGCARLCLLRAGTQAWLRGEASTGFLGTRSPPTASWQSTAAGMCKRSSPGLPAFRLQTNEGDPAHNSTPQPSPAYISQVQPISAKPRPHQPSLAHISQVHPTLANSSPHKPTLAHISQLQLIPVKSSHISQLWPTQPNPAHISQIQ